MIMISATFWIFPILFRPPLRGFPVALQDNHRSRNYAAAADGAASGSAVAALHSTWGDGSELGQEELQRLQEATTQSLEAEGKSWFIC